MHLVTARAFVVALAAPAPRHLPAEAALSSRRAVLAHGLLAASGSALVLPDRASALFESPAQASLSTIATTQSKVKGLIKEVSEIARRRTKMAADNEDDAYVLRFARSVCMHAPCRMLPLLPLTRVLRPSRCQVLQPVPAAMSTASSALKSERAAVLTSDVESSLAKLDQACRDKAADRELGELQALDASMGEFLALAEKLKYDVTAREDINAYAPAAGVLYNKWLFRAG